MEGDKKEPTEKQKRRTSPKTGVQSPSRSTRASPASSGQTSPKRPRKTESHPQESTWVPATLVKSPRGHRRSNSSADGLADEGESFHFDQDDESQPNFFMTSASGFWKYYEKKQFTDCIVITGADHVEYRAHKLILAYSSQFFFDAFKSPAAMIQETLAMEMEKKPRIGSREDSKSEDSSSFSHSSSNASVQDAGISSPTVATPTSSESSGEHVLARPTMTTVKLPWNDAEEILPHIFRYMYTGQVVLTPQNCVLISAVAERLVMPKLQRLCKDYIQASLQRENAVELLLEASKYKAQNLLKRSISNVARNFCHIKLKDVAKLGYTMLMKVLAQETLVVTDEYHLYQVVCEYCDSHRDTLSKSNILKLMSFVRFRWLTYEQFVEVSQNPLVPKSLIIEAAMARLIPHEFSVEEAAKKAANLPAHLQQRPKFSILLAYAPPAATSSSTPPATISSSASGIGLMSSIGIVASSSSPAVSSTSASASLATSSSSSSSGMVVLNSAASSSSMASSSSANGVASSNMLASSSSGSAIVATAVNPLLNPLASSQPDLASLLASSSSQQNALVSHPDIFQGVIGWIATNSNREPWKNAHIAGRVKVHSSSLAKGSRSTLVDKSPSEVWTNDIPCSWISIDLGPYRKITLTYYTLRHGLNYKADSLRTWDLQGSNDGINWKTLRRHANDRSLNSPFAAASWPIQGPVEGYRFFRILQTGHNSSNHNFLALSGFEFYGWLDITG